MTDRERWIVSHMASYPRPARPDDHDVAAAAYDSIMRVYGTIEPEGRGL